MYVILLPVVALVFGLYWLYKSSTPKIIDGSFYTVINYKHLTIERLEYDSIYHELTVSLMPYELNQYDFQSMKNTFSCNNKYRPHLELTSESEVLLLPSPILLGKKLTYDDDFVIIKFQSGQPMESLPNLCSIH